MAFADWEDVEASNPLVLPIRGKRYTIPALGHLDELRMRDEFGKVRAGEAPTLTNEEFLRMTLGSALDEMRADNVPSRAILHAATVAQTDARLGRPAAEDMWEHGPSPEALAAAMTAAAKALSPDSSTTSPSTGEAASSTKPPASTSGTRSRKPRAAKSAGRKSSNTRG